VSDSLQNDKPQINIKDFIAKAPNELNLQILAGSQAIKNKRIISSRIQKLGLALAGFSQYIHSGRVQIVGQSEIWYLSQLSKEKRLEAINNLNLKEICCILITKNLESPIELTEVANEIGLPILTTELVSSKAISLVTDFLQAELAPQLSMHGILLGMYGLGVLLLGDSGIGKSECALDLITRGHHLISDDLVLIKRIGDKLEGKSPELTYEHLEIRGLGILNIRDLFGVSAVGREKDIDVCVELKRWNEADEIDRLGLEVFDEDIFGIKLPKFILPVSSGRNLSTLVETAIRLHLLKMNGYNAAQQLIEKHSKLLLKTANNI
jgi:HPr kinase/phosphorylase